MVSQAGIDEIRRLAASFPRRESALLPALWVIQREEGYLPEESLRVVAAELSMEPSDVTSRASFYTMFALKPRGQYVIQVCQSISCSLVGAERIIDHLRLRLGVEVGETTPDDRFTLLTVECLASCGSGPVMQINEDYFEDLTVERVDEILDGLP